MAKKDSVCGYRGSQKQITPAVVSECREMACNIGLRYTIVCDVNPVLKFDVEALGRVFY